MENSPGSGKKMPGENSSGEMSCQRPPQQMRRKTGASLPDKTMQTRQ